MSSSALPSDLFISDCHEKVPRALQAGLFSSVSPSWKCPHRPTQRHLHYLIPDASRCQSRLTITITCVTLGRDLIFNSYGAGTLVQSCEVESLLGEEQIQGKFGVVMTWAISRIQNVPIKLYSKHVYWSVFVVCSIGFHKFISNTSCTGTIFTQSPCPSTLCPFLFLPTSLFLLLLFLLLSWHSYMYEYMYPYRILRTTIRENMRCLYFCV